MLVCSGDAHQTHLGCVQAIVHFVFDVAIWLNSAVVLLPMLSRRCIFRDEFGVMFHWNAFLHPKSRAHRNSLNVFLLSNAGLP